MIEPARAWDIKDEFDNAARQLFKSILLHPLNLYDVEPSPVWTLDRKALSPFRVVPDIAHGSPIFINREKLRCPYWDYPLDCDRADDVELHLMGFFDFDEIGHRDFRFFEVEIHDSHTYPDIVGRIALIEVANVKVFY